jgi:hypothetical protein
LHVSPAGAVRRFPVIRAFINGNLGGVWTASGPCRGVRNPWGRAAPHPRRGAAGRAGCAAFPSRAAKDRIRVYTESVSSMSPHGFRPALVRAFFLVRASSQGAPPAFASSAAVGPVAAVRLTADSASASKVQRALSALSQPAIHL